MAQVQIDFYGRRSALEARNLPNLDGLAWSILDYAENGQELRVVNFSVDEDFVSGQWVASARNGVMKIMENQESLKRMSYECSDVRITFVVDLRAGETLPEIDREFVKFCAEIAANIYLDARY